MLKSFGSDPEFMILDAQGQLKSAIGIVPGTKEERYSLGGGNQAYYDNVLAECSITPGTSQDDVVEKFRVCFQQYSELVGDHKLIVRSSEEYPETEREHEDAKVFGCDPEFCAYDLEVLNPPTPEVSLRSAGGHVHIGFDGGADFEQGNMSNDVWEEAMFKIAWDRIKVVRMCDLFIGIPALFLDKDPKSKRRRELYGLAGSHRNCESYGVEYRSLSNFWLARPELVRIVFDLAEIAVKVVSDGKADEIWENEIDYNILRNAINKVDLKKADTLMSDVVNRYLPKSLIKRIDAESKKPHLENLSEQWEIKV